MDVDLTSLPDDFQKLIQSKDKALQFSKKRIAHLEEQVQLLRSKLYGKKSEKVVTRKDVDQLALFDEAEIDEAVESEEAAGEITGAVPTSGLMGRTLATTPPVLSILTAESTSSLVPTSIMADCISLSSGQTCIAGRMLCSRPGQACKPSLPTLSRSSMILTTTLGTRLAEGRRMYPASALLNSSDCSSAYVSSVGGTLTSN